MKKKQLDLGRKIFLKKDVIGSLTNNEQSDVVGGDFIATANIACTSVNCTVPPDGGPATNGGSLCGTAVWRTFDAKTVCR
jgi:hypothetical protein